MSEAVAENGDVVVRLPVFEGPLDLLLYLIRRQEIDLFDIPVVEVTRQYLAVLDEMGRQDLEIAGEFFVMAATLMYLKSRVLLPATEDGVDGEDEEEPEDPRLELVGQLLEYRAFQEAGRELGEQLDHGLSRLPRQVSADPATPRLRPLRPTDPLELWGAYNAVLRRFLDRERVGEIEDDPVTVAERMESALGEIARHGSLAFSVWVGPSPGRTLVAASFLALLELARVGRLRIVQEETFGEIVCHPPVEEGALANRGEL